MIIKKLENKKLVLTFVFKDKKNQAYHIDKVKSLLLNVTY